MNILNKAIAAMPSLESVTPSLNTVLNAANAILPVARVGCYGAAAFLAGRKVYQGVGAAGFKVASIAAEKVGKNETAKSLNEASQNFYTSAKKNLVRDLTIATGLVAAGYGLEKAENYVAQALDKQNGVLNQTATAFASAASYAKKIGSGIMNSGQTPVALGQKIVTVFDNVGLHGTEVTNSISTVTNSISSVTKTVVGSLNDVRFTAPFEALPFTAKVVDLLEPTGLPMAARVVVPLTEAIVIITAAHIAAVTIFSVMVGGTMALLAGAVYGAQAISQIDPVGLYGMGVSALSSGVTTLATGLSPLPGLLSSAPANIIAGALPTVLEKFEIACSCGFTA